MLGRLYQLRCLLPDFELNNSLTPNSWGMVRRGASIFAEKPLIGGLLIVRGQCSIDSMRTQTFQNYFIHKSSVFSLLIL